MTSYRIIHQKLKQLRSSLVDTEGNDRKLEVSKKRFYFFYLPFLLLGLGSAFLIGKTQGSECKIDRKASLWLYQGGKEKGHLHSLSDNQLVLSSTTANKSSKKKENPETEEEADFLVPLDNVRRIDLGPPPIQEETYHQLSANEKRFIGRYRLQVSQHRGLFYIYRSSRSGRLNASLRFTNWGRQKLEFLHGVRVRGNTIFFQRLCRGKNCLRIGASRNLNQKFEGTLYKDRKTISGHYSGGQSGSLWKAKRY